MLDAVELNSLMPVKTELMKTSDMAEHLQLIGLSVLYAGICPISTVFVFLYFIAEDLMARYTDCYCMRRPIQENQMTLGSWLTVIEFLIGFVTISNSAILFLASGKFRSLLTDMFNIKPENQIWAVGIFEHFLLVMVILTKVFIPDFPRALKKYQEHHKQELENYQHHANQKKYANLKQENRRLSIATKALKSITPDLDADRLMVDTMRRKRPSITDFIDLPPA